MQLDKWKTKFVELIRIYFSHKIVCLKYCFRSKNKQVDSCIHAQLAKTSHISDWCPNLSNLDMPLKI